MKPTTIHIIGALLAITVGIMRSAGGFYLVAAHNGGAELGVAIVP